MDIIKARKELMMGKTIYDMALRVVDYGRVSTDKDDQLNSLENQVNYFSDMIAGVKKWVHVNSYVDEGISGTQVLKRENFLKMIEDARLGKIDLILTKEVSRFARNTIDSIKYTQLLLQYGVIVFFISDNINTIYPDSEFRLTLMASMAQDEVRKLSERVKFGIQRSIKDGKLGGGGLTGYNKKNGKLTINEDEAPIVKMLFALYATGEYGFKRIGEILAENGYYTKKGKIFSDITLKKMLKNPRYKGFYTANLSAVIDYKTHKKKNKPKDEWIIYKDEKIPVLVTEELWNKANEIYAKRNKQWRKNVLNKESYLENKNYTAKLYCKEHKTTFIRCACGKRKANPVWQCNEYLRHGIKGCQTPILKEEDLDMIFTQLFEKMMINKRTILEETIKDYQNIIKECKTNTDWQIMNDKLNEQLMFKDKLFNVLLKGLIDEDDFKLKNSKINQEINELKKTITKMKTNDIVANDIILKIKKYGQSYMNIKHNIKKYFNLFIDKVLISKINNNRKHLELEVFFNYQNVKTVIEVDLSNTKDKARIVYFFG